MASPETSSSSVTLSFNTICFTSTDILTTLYLEAVETDCTENCTTTNTSFTIQCDQNLTMSSVTVNSLNDTTSYNLSVVWISPFNSSAVCKIFQVAIKTGGTFVCISINYSLVLYASCACMHAQARYMCSIVMQCFVCVFQLHVAACPRSIYAWNNTVAACSQLNVLAYNSIYRGIYISIGFPITCIASGKFSLG